MLKIISALFVSSCFFSATAQADQVPCVFPGSTDPAPTWVCGGIPEGYENYNTAIGIYRESPLGSEFMMTMAEYEARVNLANKFCAETHNSTNGLATITHTFANATVTGGRVLRSNSDPHGNLYILFGNQPDSLVISCEKKKPENEVAAKEAAIFTPFTPPLMITIPGKNYEMGKYDVTQVEWRAVTGSNTSQFTSCGDTCPVERVSWNDIQEFLQKLNAKTGRQYRLPNEEEWEYACFGGSKTEYCGGNDIDSVAWYDKNSNNTTHPVGQKQANGYGLYDMSGNISQWMSDCYEGDCAKRVLRGGSWDDGLRLARAAFRIRFGAANRSNEYGFRLTRTLP